jgi:hypothetical protein
MIYSLHQSENSNFSNTANNFPTSNPKDFVVLREQWGEDVFHLGSSSSLAPSLYDTVRHANTAAVVESLQAQLKIREGQGEQWPCLTLPGGGGG